MRRTGNFKIFSDTFIPERGDQRPIDMHGQYFKQINGIGDEQDGKACPHANDQQIGVDDLILRWFEGLFIFSVHKMLLHI